MARSPKLNEPTEERLKTKKKYWKKEPRSINLSHEAWLLFQRLADERNLGIGDLFEVLVQEEASRSLTEQDRREIRQKAREIIAIRQKEIEETEEALRRVS